MSKAKVNGRGRIQTLLCMVPKLVILTAKLYYHKCCATGIFKWRLKSKPSEPTPCPESPHYISVVYQNSFVFLLTVELHVQEMMYRCSLVKDAVPQKQS